MKTLLIALTLAGAAMAQSPTYNVMPINAAECRILQSFIPTACNPAIMAFAQNVPVGMKVEFDITIQETVSGNARTITLYATSNSFGAAVSTELIGVDYSVVSSSAQIFAPVGNAQLQPSK